MKFFLQTLAISLLLLNQNKLVNAQEIPPVDLIKFCSEQKGFNLLGKFDVSWSNNGYSQTEFKLIHDLGFNFVRLPLDYRTYTQSGDWNKFLEIEIVEIDNAVKWGQENGVHVCINLHRAPGYCVNNLIFGPMQLPRMLLFFIGNFLQTGTKIFLRQY
jgi:aryl-phospho-beta-D-glucosidase BglC (GH1 family)